MSGTPFTPPGSAPNSVQADDGKVLTVPAGWVLLPPGDAALTRRVKPAGDHRIAQEKKGRKVFSRGVWAPATAIDRIQTKFEAERSTERFSERKEADAAVRKRRTSAFRIRVGLRKS